MEELDPGKQVSHTWLSRSYNDFTFYTGVAYVGKVRFKNGEIWSADLNAIAKNLKKIEKKFDVSKLKKKKSNKQ